MVSSRDGTRVPLFLAHRKGLPRDGTRPPCSPATAASTSTCCPPGRRRRSRSSRAAGPTRWRSCAAAASTARAGTAPACSATSRTCSTTSSRRRPGCIEQRVTAADRLAISGGSNGGLLVGAALTQRPELFRAVVCGVPLLDMLRYHLFRIAALWIPEYGSPDDPVAFRWLARLLAVSPRPRRRDVPRGLPAHGGVGHARRSDARPQDDRAPAGGDRQRPPRSAARSRARPATAPASRSAR